MPYARYPMPYALCPMPHSTSSFSKLYLAYLIEKMGLKPVPCKENGKINFPRRKSQKRDRSTVNSQT